MLRSVFSQKRRAAAAKAVAIEAMRVVEPDPVFLVSLTLVALASTVLGAFLTDLRSTVTFFVVLAVGFLRSMALMAAFFLLLSPMSLRASLTFFFSMAFLMSAFLTIAFLTTALGAAFVAITFLKSFLTAAIAFFWDLETTLALLMVVLAFVMILLAACLVILPLATSAMAL